VSRRIDQVNALLGAEVSRIVSRLKPTASVATVTAVETSQDLSQATVWVALLPDTDEAWRLLQAALPGLQDALAARIELKRTPKLRLKRDQSGDLVGKIDSLLKQS